MYEKHGLGDFYFAGYGHHLYGPPRFVPPDEALTWNGYADMRRLVYSETGRNEWAEHRKLRTVKVVLLDSYMHSFYGKELLYFLYQELSAHGRTVRDRFWHQDSSKPENEFHAAFFTLDWAVDNHELGNIHIRHASPVSSSQA